MLKRKYKIIVILFIPLFIFTACDNTEENIVKDQKYLSMALNNEYSVNDLSPGEGRYSYDENSIAKIKFQLNEGYDFDGWEGEAQSRLAQAEGDTHSYQLKMNQDSQLTLKTTLNQFELLTAELGDIKKYDYSPGMEIDNLPYNLEELRLIFNNQVNEKNELNFKIREEDGDPETDNPVIIDSEDYVSDIFSIEANKIIVNWENFNPAETEDLEFGSTYQLVISETGNTRIFDPKLNEISSEIKIDFTIEEAKPEKVENLVLETENGEIKLSWLRSEENKDYQNESYVSEYRIYEYKNESEFTKENAIEEKTVTVESPAENKILRKTITELTDLDNNTYHYRVTAVNEAKNESELSKVVSTD